MDSDRHHHQRVSYNLSFSYRWDHVWVYVVNEVCKRPQRPLAMFLHPSLSLPASFSLSLFSLKVVFFKQVVLSHSQHQHLIKPKDKHGLRSSAELISSPGIISQLPSICPNTNLLFFFTRKRRRTSKQCCQSGSSPAL